MWQPQTSNILQVRIEEDGEEMREGEGRGGERREIHRRRRDPLTYVTAACERARLDTGNPSPLLPRSWI